MTSPADDDRTEALADAVRAASSTRTPLRIVGGDTKAFYGRPVTAVALDVSGHRGIVNHDPAELVLTARAGTRLLDVQRVLASQGQHLPFEPPVFDDAATIGGTVAAALAGPARMAKGPVRDFVLGTRLLTGDGRVLRFGGEVMKNVAGYDVSRLLAGSLGILGVILEVSLKVLPVAPATRTLHRRVGAREAIETLAHASQRGAPVTASFWHAGVLHVRLEGSEAALDPSALLVGGDALAPEAAMRFWDDVRDQRHAWFRAAPRPLHRLHVPAVAAVEAFERHEAFAFEWNGAQRWVAGIDVEAARRLARDVGGHATLFRGATAADEVFVPLSAPMLELHRDVKRVFDPAGILNPGRMYAAL
jgi:glycolate dehydrogenase FAD-binding subunit